MVRLGMSVAIGIPSPVYYDTNVVPELTADRIGPTNQP